MIASLMLPASLDEEFSTAFARLIGADDSTLPSARLR